MMCVCISLCLNLKSVFNTKTFSYSHIQFSIRDFYNVINLLLNLFSICICIYMSIMADLLQSLVFQC